MLVSVWTFAILTAISSTLTIFKLPILDKLGKDSAISPDLHLIAGAVISTIQLLKILAFVCLKKCIDFSVLMLTVIAELLLSIVAGIVMAFLGEGELALGIPLLSLGVSFGLVAWPLMKLHLDLMANHLTEKEWDSRMKTCEKLNVNDEMIEGITCGQKV